LQLIDLRSDATSQQSLFLIADEKSSFGMSRFIIHNSVGPAAAKHIYTNFGSALALSHIYKHSLSLTEHSSGASVWQLVGQQQSSRFVLTKERERESNNILFALALE